MSVAEHPRREPLPLEEQMVRATNRVVAANFVYEGRHKEYLGALMVGTPNERESARQAVLAAMETVLDAEAVQAWCILMEKGIDPENRG